MRKLLSITLLLVSVSIPVSAFAIVNVEQAIIGPGKEGLSNHVEVAVDGSSGNTNKNSTSAEGLSQWLHGRHTEFLLLQYAYGKSNGLVDTNRFFGHLRHRTMVGDAWGIEVFGQAGRNPFARLSLRTLLGGGVRWTLMEEPNRAGIYLGLGAFYEHERLSPKAGTSDPLDSRLWRANSYLVLKRQFSDQVRLYSTTFYQPAFRHPADYRLLEQLAAAIRLYKQLDLKLRLDVSYDSLPPQGVKRSDVRYSTGIAVNF